MWDHFPHLPSYLHFLHTCALVAQRRFARLPRFSARGRKSSRQCDESTSRPSPKLDKGKGKMPEYKVEEHPDDSDSDDSACSLDSEFGVPIMRTLGVKEGAHIDKRKTPPLITSEDPSHSVCLQRVYGP